MHEQPRASSIWRAALLVALVNLLGVVGTLYLTVTAPHGDPSKDSPVGWIAVGSSIIAFGSYGLLIKLPEVQKAHPQVFQLYYSSGVVITSLLVLTFKSFHFSFWGFAGAAIWVGSQLCAFVAINRLGYGVAVATWASLTMVVSFLWGAIAFSEEPQNVGASIGALTALGLGVAAVAAAQSAPQSSSGGRSHDADALIPADDTTVPKLAARGSLAGWAGAAGCGLLNGSLMVPLHYYSAEVGGDEQSAIAYLASFAFGICAVTPLSFVLILRWPVRKAPPLYLREAALPGLVTGVFWAVGNLQACYATIYLGQAIGYPLTQTAIVIAGLWSVFFFREVTGAKAIALFSVGVVVIIGGAVLLGLYG